MEKILSISIASYNIEKYIRETLNSLLHPNVLGKMEILIISDGSTDGTAEIGKEYEEKYPESIRVIEKQNGGWGSTVNEGIRRAAGKYFKLLDGDDQYVTENLPDFINYLETQDADLVMTPYCEFEDSTGRVKRTVSHGEFARNGALADDIPDDFLPEMHECCFKTEILKKNNIRITEHCFYTDVEFVLKGLAVSDSFGYLDKPIYLYRVDSDGQSISIKGVRAHYKDYIKTTLIMLEYEKNYNKNVKIKRAIQQRMKRSVTMMYNMFCMLEGKKEEKEQAIGFDTRLKKEYPRYYGNTTKKIGILRKSKFVLYPLICRFYTWKERTE